MKSARKVLAIAVSAAMLGITAVPAFAASDFSKDETVYVVTEADGSQSEITVSDHLKNGIGADKIHDRTDLKNIENVKGEETFRSGSGDEIVWNAEGNDIFYDGNTEKAVPVQLGISYFLNGEEVQGKDMEGASGDVKIVIHYRNETKGENGSTVPFIALTGFIAEDECLQDVEIDHGKVIDDGDKKIVAAFAAPGLSDSLNIDEDLIDLDLEDTVTITATAKDFQVEDMMTVVTNSMFEEVDTDDFADLDYDDQIKELEKGGKSLMDGSKQLYQGINILYGKMPQLKGGVKKLADGADELSDGTNSALDGSKQLSQGLEQLGESLSTKLSDAAAGVTRMKSGSDQVLDGMEKMQAGLEGDGTAENPGAVNALGQVENGLEQVIEGLEAADSGASPEQIAQLKKAAKDVSDYMDQVNSLVDKHSVELKAAGYGKLVEATSGVKKEANAVSAGVDKIGGGGGGLDDAIAGLKQAKGGVSQVKGGLGQMSQNMPALVGGMTQINDGLTQLDEMFTKITDMSGQISGSVGQLVKGSQDLAEGEVQLAGGAKQLADGMQKLQDKSQTLSGGVSKLDAGSLKLSKGMTTMYNDGIRKIVDLYNDDLKGSVDDLTDLIDAGQDYRTFTELADGMDGSVKFIYKTTVY